MKKIFLQYQVNKLKKGERKGSNVSFDRASNIGVLFDSEEEYGKSSSWLKELSANGKTVKSLVKIKKAGETKPSFNYFTEKELNFFGQIGEGNLSKFVKENFDFLFYFGKDMQLTNQMILLKNQARCRVGFHQEGIESLFDLMFAGKNGSSSNESVMEVINRIKEIKVDE